MQSKRSMGVRIKADSMQVKLVWKI